MSQNKALGNWRQELIVGYLVNFRQPGILESLKKENKSQAYIPLGNSFPASVSFSEPVSFKAVQHKSSWSARGGCDANRLSVGENASLPGRLRWLCLHQKVFLYTLLSSELQSFLSPSLFSSLPCSPSILSFFILPFRPTNSSDVLIP